MEPGAHYSVEVPPTEAEPAPPPEPKAPEPAPPREPKAPEQQVQIVPAIPRPLEQRHANAQAARLGAGGHARAVQRRQPGLHRGGRFFQRTLASDKSRVTLAASLPPQAWPVSFPACQSVF